MTFGSWVVLDGTGDDASLRGQGTVTGTFVPDGVSDLYTGWLALRQRESAEEGPRSLW